ncbi:hypothetical protein BgiMline_012421, partial [Biomphalaria glabrata]
MKTKKIVSVPVDDVIKLTSRGVAVTAGWDHRLEVHEDGPELLPANGDVGHWRETRSAPTFLDARVAPAVEPVPLRWQELGCNPTLVVLFSIMALINNPVGLGVSSQ